jgi:hypothetical protein
MRANPYSEAVSLFDSGCHRFIVKRRVFGTQAFRDLFSAHAELDVVDLCLFYMFPNDPSSFLRTVCEGSDAWN